MRVVVLALSAVVLVTAVSGCAEVRRSMGQDKTGPDEFAVVSRAPLTLPPEYRLRPPTPGSARPQEGTTTERARRVLTGVKGNQGGTQISANSQGQLSLLRSAGAEYAEKDIRRIVDAETTSLAEDDENFTQRLLFWKESNPEDGFGTIVDAKGELDRIRKNQALGEDVSDGDTPVIERRPQGIFEGLFK